MEWAKQYIKPKNLNYNSQFLSKILIQGIGAMAPTNEPCYKKPWNSLENKKKYWTISTTSKINDFFSYRFFFVHGRSFLSGHMMYSH